MRCPSTSTQVYQPRSSSYREKEKDPWIGKRSVSVECSVERPEPRVHGVGRSHRDRRSLSSAPIGRSPSLPFGRTVTSKSIPISVVSSRTLRSERRVVALDGQGTDPLPDEPLLSTRFSVPQAAPYLKVNDDVLTLDPHRSASLSSSGSTPCSAVIELDRAPTRHDRSRRPLVAANTDVERTTSLLDIARVLAFTKSTWAFSAGPESSRPSSCFSGSFQSSFSLLTSFLWITGRWACGCRRKASWSRSVPLDLAAACIVLVASSSQPP